MRQILRIGLIGLMGLMGLIGSTQAQTDWKKVGRLIDDGSYKSAYAQAERAYKAELLKTKNNKQNSSELLTAAWYMMQASVWYQEDALDSTEARYRTILPYLEAPERAVCYAMLGEPDSALLDEELLKKTSSERIRQFCTQTQGKGINVTLTVFDVVVLQLAEYHRDDRVPLLQKLIDFHSADGDDLRIWLDLEMLETLLDEANRTDKEGLVKSYINKYRASKCGRKTRFYSLKALLLEGKGRYEEAIRYCDTAIALAPKSRGGADAQNLRNRITQTGVSPMSYTGYHAIPNRPSLQKLCYRNASHLYFGLSPYREEMPSRFDSTWIFLRWDMEVDTSDRYNRHSILFEVPALEAGRWALVISTDEVFDGKDAVLEINCTDMEILRTSGEGLFQLVNSVTGGPIVGQEVEFYRKRNGEYEKLFSVVTDSDGRFRADEESGKSYWVKIERDGYEYFSDFWPYTYRVSEEKAFIDMLCDRPVYRPGDTVHVAAVLAETDGVEGHVRSGKKMTLKLFNPNTEIVDTIQVLTDDFGVATATFVIDKEAMAGQWQVDAYFKGEDYATGFLHFPVEEYKQPKFMVTLDASKNISEGAKAPAFGEPYTVQGLAQAYSGASIGGAKVKYHVTRHTMWYRYRRYFNAPSTEIVSDSTVTAADGSFAVTFTPLPDSSVELGNKPNFRYEIYAEVTDLNGETHYASSSVMVGYHNTILTLSGLSDFDVSSLESVSVALKDINERPMEGEVTVKLSRLHTPDTARMLPQVMAMGDDYVNTISRERFRQLFPTYAYDREEYYLSNFKSDWDWSSTQHVAVDELQHKVQLPELKSGYYRIVATCGDEADTGYVLLTLPKERRVQTRNLLWADIQINAKSVTYGTAYPGDRITFRYASAFDDVRFFYVLAGPDGIERESRWLQAGRKIKSFTIDVDSTMLGGFSINLFAVKDGVVEECKERIDVPFRHKQLKVDIATFRDKLLPGEQEEWKIKVNGLQGYRGTGLQGHSAALIMTMYDDALSEYGQFPFRFVAPWRSMRIHNSSWLSRYAYCSNYFSPFKYVQGNDPAIVRWGVDSEFMEFMSYQKNGYEIFSELSLDEMEEASSARGESGSVRNRKMAEVSIVAERAPVIEIGTPESGQRMASNDIAHMPGNSVDAVVTTVGGMGYSDGHSVAPRKPVEMRTNLNTLAFFVADLRTDSSGTATYRFRVPDLLTRWRVRGVALSDDLKIGTLDKSLVTQKPLMVQPNIPRFLRHGDSLVLMAKVVNLTDSVRKVQVEFSLKNANGGDFLIRNYAVVPVPAQGSLQVSFPVDHLPDDLFVATYEIVAYTLDNDGEKAALSDGERGQIPVVSSRQAVTLSQPVYINGKGEKTFHFPLSTFRSSTTATPHLLAAELTTDPVWLAVKSMPYLKEQENPSTLYLANSLYINTLASNILKDFKGLRDLKDLWDTTNTRLKINEDIKQTLLEATPWLRDAQSEVEQRQALANYFDSATLNSQFSILNSQLAERQNADGGWSWMPEGESSTWVTMQILKRLSLPNEISIFNFQFSIQNALAYVDREEQHHYEKYIKPYLKKGYNWEPDNIDYLYTRSFYGKGSTEAYKFYYNNALKNYKTYNNLYTQAQLALIFQRHGDKKAARDLIRRLKEKCLVSDEMGMYWRDNRSGWCWYERPIETQALLIQAFREVTPNDTASIGLMQQWLLKQKQTTHWGNDRATVEAINALMTPENPNTPSNPNTPTALHSTTLTLCGVDLTAPSEGLEGYRSQRWEGPALDSIIRLEDSRVTIRKNTPGIAWGAVYFQYTDDMDKIPSSESGITLKRTYSKVLPTNDNPQPTFKVGDRVRVRIEISVDRNMEYLELIDGRPSCVEPLSTRAGWNWSSGLSYYVEVKNTATHCYINRLEKGKYVVEYDVYVTNPGTFLAGPVTMQCMYAPEFRATAPAQRLIVE